VKVFPKALSVIAKSVIAFVAHHPAFAHTFHVALNAIPDFAFLLLTLAGLSYLMPRLITRIENSFTLQITIFSVFLFFGVLAIVVNAINRTNQETKQGELQGKLDTQGQKIEIVSQNQVQTLNFLHSSKGQPLESERRKSILENLRGQYVIDHPDVPVTMLTGDTWPPKDWMDKKLRELGETFPFIPPAINLNNAQAKEPLKEPPPAMDLTVVVGRDDTEHTQLSFDASKEISWIDMERACAPPFICYPERDFASHYVELNIGSKNWARIFFTVYNVGGSNLIGANVSINLSHPADVSINRINRRPNLTDAHDDTIMFVPPETGTLVAFNKSKGGSDFPVDVTIGPTVTTFALGFRIFGENMPAHFVVVPILVKRTD
jgi:hypothetical protein